MQKYKGHLSLFLVTALFGIYGIFFRLIGFNFGVFSQEWLRSGLLAAVTLTLVIVTKKWQKIRRQDLKNFMVFLSASLGSTISIFLAFNLTSIAAAFFLAYTGIIVSGFLSGKFLFGEKISLVKITAVIFSLLGLAIIYWGQPKGQGWIGPTLAFGSGLCSGFWYAFSKKFSQNYGAVQLTGLDALGRFFGSFLLAMIFRENFPSLKLSVPWLGIFLLTATQFAAIPLTVYGFKRVEAQIGTLVLPLETVFGTLFAFIFFQEIPAIQTLIGGVLILFSSVLPIFTKPQLNQFTRNAEPE